MTELVGQGFASLKGWEDFMAIRNAKDGEYVAVSQETITNLEHGAVWDVTAWGEVEPKHVSEPLLQIPFPDSAIRVASPLVRKAKLADVFNEAIRTATFIIWRDNLPPVRRTPATLERILEFMLDSWGELPPYIKIDDYGWYIYSIKPVWEL